MPFLPTKIQDDKFDNRGTAQGFFLCELNDTLSSDMQVT